MRAVDAAVRCAAEDDITVLLLGETGVGKEVAAERLHDLSPRRRGPFVRVHCAAITSTLLEAELFGHEAHAFTGADRARPGLLESADGGTVFVDEIGELGPAVQVKLLRVLEDRRSRRMGGRAERRLDVRFVAATNRDLEAEVAAGRFRKDLYFRLMAFPIRIPPLRERREEILPLARHFVRQRCQAKGVPAPTIAPELAAWLEAYPWPGNARELRNVMRRLLLVSDGERLRLGDLPTDEMRVRAATMMADGVTEGGLDHPDERKRIEAALARTGGNQTAAAKLLGVSRRTLVSRLDRYAIPRPRKRVPAAATA